MNNILYLKTDINKINTWPFREANNIIDNFKKFGYPKKIIFATGYGPSGLPHIGTFSEVLRTSMICHAFRTITKGNIDTELICFSDDMDGLRKIPDNIPNSDSLYEYIGKSLNSIPDPFCKERSFAEYNNKKLCNFLNHFNFKYKFISSTEYYKSGFFDQYLIKILNNYDKIVKIISKTLGNKRKENYSPFLPISPSSGKVLQALVVDKNIIKNTITYIDPDTLKTVETKITKGNVKCQWKIDWAMRWIALNIHYEMFGKDLIDSFKLSSKICSILGSTPPIGFHYELFLDEKGKKISKSKGNGISIDDWTNYAPIESLSFYMYKKPKTAKKLYFNIIPKIIDEYYIALKSYNNESWYNRLNNPVWYIYYGNPKNFNINISFSMILNLINVSNIDKVEIIWEFIARYLKIERKEKHDEISKMINFAISYFNDFVKPKKIFRIPDETECIVLQKINEELIKINTPINGKEIQNKILSIARNFKRYRNYSSFNPEGGPGISIKFFQMLYEIIFGQNHGPRIGSFIELYGIKKTIKLISFILNKNNK